MMVTLIRSALTGAVASIALSQAQTAQTQGLPEGEGKDLTQQVCSTCHEINLVTAERHSEQQWKALVDDMVRRGAEASDADKKVILAYLVKNFGK
jgi:mono/diheme cytochrome c family protein